MNSVSLIFKTLSEGKNISELIFLMIVPLIINSLDCTLITLRSFSVKMIFLIVELIILRLESLTLMNYPL